MKQSRLDSLMEAITNVVIGFTINLIANWLILPWFLDVEPDFASFAALGAMYTAVSVARSYVIRRAFNGRTVWQTLRDHDWFGRNHPCDPSPAELREFAEDVDNWR